MNKENSNEIGKPQASAQGADSFEKKDWKAPSLTDLGDVRSLTRNGMNSGTDGFGTNTAS